MEQNNRLRFPTSLVPVSHFSHFGRYPNYSVVTAVTICISCLFVLLFSKIYMQNTESTVQRDPPNINRNMMIHPTYIGWYSDQ